MSDGNTPAPAKRIEFPGVNACVRCDCGNLTFRIGIQSDIVGNNEIRCLECDSCGHKLAVPFYSDRRMR